MCLKFPKIHCKAPVPEPPFSKVAGIQSATYKRNSGTGVLYLFHRDKYYSHLNYQKNVYRNSCSQVFFELKLRKTSVPECFLNEIAVP